MVAARLPFASSTSMMRLGLQQVAPQQLFTRPQQPRPVRRVYLWVSAPLVASMTLVKKVHRQHACAHCGSTAISQGQQRARNDILHCQKYVFYLHELLQQSKAMSAL
jgi:hypothetical protein